MIPAPLLVGHMISVLFVCGTVGNCYAIGMVIRYFWQQRTSAQPWNNGDSGHILIYTLAKSAADGAMLICCPLIVYFIMHDSWSLGYVLCLMYWVNEQVCAKTSILILACLTFDRYAWLYRPVRWAPIFRVRSAIIACSVVNILVLVIVSPVLPRVGPFHAVLDTNANTTVVETCNIDIAGAEYLVGVCLVIWAIITFLLPVLISLLCIFCSFKFLFGNQHAVEQLGENRYSIERTISVCLGGAFAFYLICATPHLIMSLLISMSSLFESPRANETFLMFILHLLPYLNAAGAWMFSALINRAVLKFIRQQGQDASSQEGQEMVEGQAEVEQGPPSGSVLSGGQVEEEEEEEREAEVAL